MATSFAVDTIPFSVLSGLPSARRLLIFTFHRVLAEPDPLLAGEPSAFEFNQIASYIARYLNVLPLTEAAQKLSAGQLPPRAACITFDDGYRNNYDVASPILERYRLPATFFIATGATEIGCMWNDLIIEAVRFCRDQIDVCQRGLGVLGCRNDAEKTQTINAIVSNLKYEDLDKRYELARDIYSSVTGGEPPKLMMSARMVRDLQRRNFEIGAHTVNHPILSRLSHERAESEIRTSKAWLDTQLDRKVTSFAYPNGRPGLDFTPHHEAMVRNAGFTCAVSTQWGAATRGDSLMALPRFSPWERTRRTYWLRIFKTYVSSHLNDWHRASHSPVRV